MTTATITKLVTCSLMCAEKMETNDAQERRRLESYILRRLEEAAAAAYPPPYQISLAGRKLYLVEDSTTSPPSAFVIAELIYTPFIPLSYNKEHTTQGDLT